MHAIDGVDGQQSDLEIKFDQPFNNDPASTSAPTKLCVIPGGAQLLLFTDQALPFAG
ncbi:hypothetical protein D3C77_659190 [compost metagenome]